MRFPQVILNDIQALYNAVDMNGEVGFFILFGDAEYDTDGSFKRWHDQLKGKKSRYVQMGEEIGRKNRRRKSSVDIYQWAFYLVKDEELGMAERREGGFSLMSQPHNSNGKPRPPKLVLDTDVVIPLLYGDL